MGLYGNFRSSSKIIVKNATYFGTHQNSGIKCCSHNLPALQKREKSTGGKAAECKIALVTGGARGIGFCIAESLLQEGAQSVILGDILVDECEKATCILNEKYGENKCLFHPLDVTDQAELEKVFKCIKARFGRIDIVVNNAGILQDKRWEDTLMINCGGTVHGTLLGFQHMGINNCGIGGTVINVSSILGLQPCHGAPVYTGTKHFVIGFTRSFGSDFFYKMTKVKVMAVLPGVTDTNMITESSQGALPQFKDLGKELDGALKSLPNQKSEEVGKCVINMLKAGENGSIWVSEACECYKVTVPDRLTLKPKEDPCKKKEDPCKPKEDPCKPKEDPCKKKEDPCKKKEDPCKKIEPIKPNQDPCKPKADPGKKKEDPCKKKEDPCKKKEDPCKKKEDPCKKKEDPCKPKEEHSKKTEPSKPKEDPCKPKEDPCKKKEDPCKKKEEPSKPKDDKKHHVCQGEDDPSNQDKKGGTKKK